MMSLGVDTFRAFVEGDGKMRDIMMAYTQALFVQIAQAVACNGIIAHPLPPVLVRGSLRGDGRIRTSERVLPL